LAPDGHSHIAFACLLLTADFAGVTSVQHRQPDRELAGCASCRPAGGILPCTLTSLFAGTFGAGRDLRVRARGDSFCRLLVAISRPTGQKWPYLVVWLSLVRRRRSLSVFGADNGVLPAGAARYRTGLQAWGLPSVFVGLRAQRSSGLFRHGKTVISLAGRGVDVERSRGKKSKAFTKRPGEDWPGNAGRQWRGNRASRGGPQ